MIAECLILAGTLGAGVFIGADCVKLSARAKIAEARVDAKLAHDDAVKAQAQRVGALTAMNVLAQRLADERQTRAAAELRATTAEGHLSDLRAAAAEQEAADEPAALPLGVHVFQPVPDGAPWVPNFGGAA